MLLVFGFFVLMAKLTSLRTFSECIRYWPAFVGGGYFSRLFSNSDIQRRAIFVAFALILMVDPGIKNILSILIICCVLYLLLYLGCHLWEKTIVNKWAILVSNTSFEIYLFHQFVINTLLILSIQMKCNLYIVPLVSLIINILVLPYLIQIEKCTVYWIKTIICQNR